MNLLPSNILQSPIQIPHLLRNLTHLPFIRALNCARLSNCQIHREFHLSLTLATAQPSPSSVSRWREADTVVAGVGGAEGELAGVRALSIDNPVVVVEDFIDGYGNGHIWVWDVGVALLGVVLGSGIVALSKVSVRIVSRRYMRRFGWH